MLKLINVSISSNNNKIVNNFSFDFLPGTATRLCGENGSGKTTLLKAIAGIIPHSGTIYFNNKNLSILNGLEVSKENIFLSYQVPPCIRGVSAKSLLQIIYKNKYKEDLPNEKIIDICSSLNLNPLILDRDFNFSFSGGEKKKLELIQMILLNPSVYLLDELDAGMDSSSIKFLSKFIKQELLKDKIFIITTHQENSDLLLNISKSISVKDEQ